MKHLYPVNPIDVPINFWNKTTSLVAITVKALFLSTCLLFAAKTQAQYSPSNPGKFGIDGDVSSDVRQQGTFAAAGSHDWFYKKNGTGAGIFDQSDSTSLKTILSSGANYAFSKRMQATQYSIQNGQFYIDALYARDYIGNDAALDKTVFVANSMVSNKNSQDPATWVTVPAGSLVPSKSDIVDAYIHMRRDGINLSAPTPSDMMLYLGVSLMSTGGDHFVDFELFRNEVNYNSLTGTFPTAGPSSTGGRNIWEFNADGSVKTFGEMTISYSFNNSSVNDISIYIWVPKTTYLTTVPKNFTFTSDWNASITNANYGYAKILPKTAQIYSWAAVSNATTAGPAWGTTSKELGAQTSNYYSANYSTGQFAEAAVDLTLIGTDPALVAGYDKCTPPYRRVMIKTRSSSAFSSALQDFAGPFEFANAPVLSVNIAPPTNLTCTNNSVQLSTDNLFSGVSYSWTTTNGNIVSGANTSTPVVDKPGEYIVTTSAATGCYPAKDTITVYQDIKKPVAKISIAGVLLNLMTDSVTLRGGDTSASKYSNAYSSYQGLTYNWSGPDNFTSTAQSFKTNVTGNYSLVVTQISNGCKDTANDVVTKQLVLPIKLKSFTGVMQNSQAKLEWSVDENQSGDHFELQSSIDGKQFTSVQTIPVRAISGTVSYRLSVPSSASMAYYRLVLVNRNSLRSMSKVILLDSNNPDTESLQIVQNPVVAAVQFTYSTAMAGEYTATIYNAAGMMVQQSKVYCAKGLNRLSIALNGGIGSGNFILGVSGQSTQHITRFVKM